MKKVKGAKHDKPVVERGKGGIMTEELVYNQAYKRVRLAELLKGSGLEIAKKIAAEEARNAVDLFRKGLDLPHRGCGLLHRGLGLLHRARV